jgi:hypothetical protein
MISSTVHSALGLVAVSLAAELVVVVVNSIERLSCSLSLSRR